MTGELPEPPVRGFRALVTAPTWAALVQSGTRREFQAGDRLLEQGRSGDWVLAVLAGRVKVLYSEPAGHELLLAVRGPGDLLGEFAGRDRGPRMATVQALEPCIAHTLSMSEFTEFIRRNSVGDALERYVMAKVRETARRTWQVAHQRIATRMAGLMCALIGAAGPDHAAPHQIPMSQEDIATALGVVRSSISPVLADWRERGLVELGRGRITVLNPSGLRDEQSPRDAHRSED